MYASVVQLNAVQMSIGWYALAQNDNGISKHLAIDYHNKYRHSYSFNSILTNNYCSVCV